MVRERTIGTVTTRKSGHEEITSNRRDLALADDAAVKTLETQECANQHWVNLPEERQTLGG